MGGVGGGGGGGVRVKFGHGLVKAQINTGNYLPALNIIQGPGWVIHPHREIYSFGFVKNSLGFHGSRKALSDRPRPSSMGGPRLGTPTVGDAQAAPTASSQAHSHTVEPERPPPWHTT